MAFRGFQPRDDEGMDGTALRSQMRTTPPTAVPAAPSVVTKPDAGMPSVKPEAPPAAEPAAPPTNGFDGSGYGSWSGYLQGATQWLQPQVRAAKNEAEAKSIVQNYLNSIAPELQKRGANVGKIKNEAITIDGREYDTFRDIGGASEAQMLELGLPAAGGGAQAASRAMGIAPPADGTSYGGIQSLMPTDDAATAQMMERLKAILGGDAAFDRQALLAQMQR